MGKVIGVISLKGGVGKTTVVTNLGHAISEFGKKVLLIDGNFSAPNLGLHLNVIEPEATLHDVLSRKVKVNDAIHNMGNFDIIPADMFNRSQINYLSLKNYVNRLKKQYDVVIIDSSPTLGDETLAVMLASDALLVVTTPDHPTLSTTLKAIKSAKQRGSNIDGLIINKVHNKSFELGHDDVEDTAEVPIMAVINHDLNIKKSVSEMHPNTKLKPKSKSSEEIKRLAGTIVGEKYKPVKLKRLYKWVNPSKSDINREIYYKRVFED